MLPFDFWAICPKNKRGYCSFCKTLFVRHSVVDVIFSSWRLSSWLFSWRFFSLRLSLPFFSHLLSDWSVLFSFLCSLSFDKEHFIDDDYTELSTKSSIFLHFFLPSPLQRLLNTEENGLK